jgi:hypothetical protein
MKSEKSHHTKNKREFGGCVELIPDQPDYIEFIDSRRIWGFAIHRLTHFVLQENPNCFGQKTLPPDLLFLIYPPAIVVLKGWRLEQLVGPLVNGRVARIHAEKHLGTLIIEEAWVSEIHVIQPNKTFLQPDKLETWIAEQT